jgi:beta-glucanase (GH16 family)
MRLIRALAILLPALVLAACGTGDGQPPIRATPFVGVLVNSPVEGAEFSTATQSGLTSADGEFRYLPGEVVTFAVGGIQLGTVAGAPLLTPVELTGSPDPGTATTPNAATKLLRFLQSVDVDSNALNGITISNNTRTMAASLSLDFTSASDAEVDAVIGMVTDNPPVDSETALDNFYETYKSLGGSNTFSWPFPGYPPFPGSGTVDLLINGGFEEPNASAGDVYCSTGWQCFNAGNFTNNTAGPSSGPVSHEPGTQSLKQFGVDSGAFQTVEAVAGATYEASVWAMNWTGDPLNNLGIVQLTFWDGPDGTGNQLGPAFEDFVDSIDDSTNVYLPEQDGAETTDWTQITVSGSAPPGTVSAKLLLIHVLTPPAFGGGTVRWDDATLNGPAPEPPPAEELLTNGGFELPDASAGDVYCSNGWQCFNAGNFTNNTAGPGFGPVSHEPGTQSLKQFGVDSGAFQTVAAVPGSPYVASVWAMNWTGDPLNNLGIVQLTFWDGPNGTGTQIGPAFEDFVDPIDDGTNIYLPEQDGAETTDWTQITVSGTAPPNTASAKLLLIHVLTPPAFGGGTVRWDEASLIGTTAPPPGGLTLAWQDEFNSGTAPDPNTWTLQTGYGNFGWGNDEWQLFTNDPSNVSIVYQDPADSNNGYLSISARLDTAQCPSPAPPPGCGKRDGSITSARINSLPSQLSEGLSFRFGRIEASIKLPVGVGTWPAFWMLGEKFPVTGWPKAGEIDIVELFDRGGTSNREPLFTIHWCDESLVGGLCAPFPTGYRTVTSKTNLGVSLGNAFHVYEAEWTASGIVWRVDDVTYYSAAIQPATMEEFLEAFFVILNVAIGGNPVPPPSATGWPRTMLVDWVRVYQ